MLTATGIYKKYGHLAVLKGVDISIKKGEIVSIVGIWSCKKCNYKVSGTAYDVKL